MPFKKLFDALTKGPVLEDAFDKAGEMHERSAALFEKSFEVAMGQEELSKKELKEMDIKINKLMRAIRRDIYQYLSVASKPNVNASLILTSIVIDYERIGDISANIAEINDIYGICICKSKYAEDLTEIKEMITKLFKMTVRAFDKEDEEGAKAAIELHDRIKKKHSQLIQKMIEQNEIDNNEAIAVAMMGYYFRRINAHLSNIDTTVLLPFPSMGFASKLLDEVD